MLCHYMSTTSGFKFSQKQTKYLCMLYIVGEPEIYSSDETVIPAPQREGCICMCILYIAGQPEIYSSDETIIPAPWRERCDDAVPLHVYRQWF